MANTSQLNQAQRQAFEKTLYESLRKAEREHERKDEEARAIALQKLIEEKDAVELAKQFNEYELKRDEARSALEALGFIVRGSGIELDYDAPQELKEALRKTVDELTSAERAKVEAITAAIQKAWTVSTLDEAKDVVAAFA
jgi:hypothetical protein